jgi:hypothetical protein
VGFNLDAYGFILRDDKFWQAFGVSVLRVLLGGALNFVLAVLTAFPLSRSVQGVSRTQRLHVALCLWHDPQRRHRALVSDDQRLQAARQYLGAGAARRGADLERDHADELLSQHSQGTGRSRAHRRRQSVATAVEHLPADIAAGIGDDHPLQHRGSLEFLSSTG